MNILFYTVFEVSPLKGGTERITDTIATCLQNSFGVKVFSAYSIPINPEFERTKFSAVSRVPFDKDFERKLYDCVKQYDIDIIINQGLGLTASMKSVLNKFPNKYLISVHHFNPGAEKNFFNLHHTLYELKTSKSLKSFIRHCITLAFYPILKSIDRKKQINIYRQTYNNSDRVVLLSENFKDEWKAYAGIQDDSKFAYIHNALSFKTFFDIKDYGSKKKEVLIVSRLDERQKRLSLALKIWKTIEKNPQLDNWKLTIVGHGDEYLKMYKDYIRRENLQRVSLEGAQKPVEYYKRASLFLLTSAYEGWGLTLTEAQQFGVVPLAFNSYASLTDIITDGKNGYVIPNDDLDLYTEKLSALMLDDGLRKQMALNSIRSSKRFTDEKICCEWMNLLNQVMAG